MPKTFFKYLLLLALFPAFTGMAAQDSIPGLESSDSLDTENPWLLSTNRAGMVFSRFLPDGDFALGLRHEQGDYHRVQASPEAYRYGFRAQKMVRFSDLVFDGGFNYYNQQQNLVGWTSRMNPFTNNPYMLADSMRGRYSKDYVEINGSLAYLILPRISLGLGVDYMVGDGARIKDPRPVNAVFSMDIKPSLVYSLPGFKVGLSLRWMKGREEISYKTIENAKTYRLFRQFGLGIGAKTINTWSYKRNYYLNGLGAGLQAEYQLGELKVFHALDYVASNEAAEDGSYNPRKNDAGDYLENILNFSTSVSFGERFQHTVRVFADWNLGSGSEFIQEPYAEKGITYYRTVAVIDKYSFMHLLPGFEYRVSKPYTPYLNKWDLCFGLEALYEQESYLLEAEQQMMNLLPSFSISRAFVGEKSSLALRLDLEFSTSLDKELRQLRPYTALQNKAVWKGIVEPDFQLRSGSAYTLGTGFKYGRFVRVVKKRSQFVYIDLDFRYTTASHEAWAAPKTRSYFAISLGLNY